MPAFDCYGCDICAACPVDRGNCPNCGTFWIVRRDGKRVGVTQRSELGLAWARAVLSDPPRSAVEFSGVAAEDIARLRYEFEIAPRIVGLERRADAINAELAGLRSGILPLIEQRAAEPDAVRTPPVIAREVGLSVQQVNNVCVRMLRAGIVQRQRAGGRTFAYTPASEESLTSAPRPSSRNVDSLSAPEGESDRG